MILNEKYLTAIITLSLYIGYKFQKITVPKGVKDKFVFKIVIIIFNLISTTVRCILII